MKSLRNSSLAPSYRTLNQEAFINIDQDLSKFKLVYFDLGFKL